MLRPSYTELMEVLNNDENVDMKVTSRYTIVIAASKRARQLIDGSKPLSKADSDKSVSVAINEMFDSKLNIISRYTTPEQKTEFDNTLGNADYLMDSDDSGYE